MHLLGHKRKIGKKTYKAMSSHHTKTNAKERARIYRNKGFKTRVIPSTSKEDGKEYYVWKEM
jgi:hypothetical protein